MARTLQQLQESIQQLIKEQGPDAPVAAFIYTQNDVFTVDEETLDEQYLPIDTVTKVLDQIESYDYLNEQAYEMIDDAIRMVNK